MNATPSEEQELRNLYRRCDVSNNMTINIVGEDEFIETVEAYANAKVSAMLDEFEAATKNLPTWETLTMIDGFDALEAIQALRNKLTKKKGK